MWSCYDIFWNIKRCGIHSVSIACRSDPVRLWCPNAPAFSLLFYSHQLDVSNRKMVTHDINAALKERSYQRNTKQRGVIHFTECAYIWVVFVRVYEFLRGRDWVFTYKCVDGDSLCLCAPFLSLYPIWFVLLMWFAVAGLWSWFLRNECSLIFSLSHWCWGSKVMGFWVAFQCNLFATNAFILQWLHVHLHLPSE